MKKFIHKLVIKIRFLFIKCSKQYHYEQCYYKMETQNQAAFRMCGGLSGGDRYTDGLSYTCVSCPYLVLGPKKKEDQNA